MCVFSGLELDLWLSGIIGKINKTKIEELYSINNFYKTIKKYKEKAKANRIIILKNRMIKHQRGQTFQNKEYFFLWNDYILF